MRKVRWPILGAMLTLILAGCGSPPPPIYFAERPHIQTAEIIRQSNRFPDPANRDTFYWYQSHSIRSTRLDENYSTATPQGPSSGQYGVPGQWNGGGYGNGGYGAAPFYSPAVGFPAWWW